MKKTLKVGLGGAALVAFFFFVTTHFTSCKSSAGRANSTERIVIPVPIRTNDSSSGGNNTGTGGRPLLIKNPVQWPVGTVLVFECANKDCADLPGSSNSAAAPRSPKILFEMRIPYDLPANTEMSLSFRPAPGTK